jgi:DNA polymerase-3 subunit delta'
MSALAEAKEDSTMAWGVVGHDWAIELLQQGLASDRVAHAFIFSGPAQIGKTLLARSLAQAINCKQEGNRPCGHCSSCRKINENTHPDVHLIKGEGAKGSIKIDQMRSLQREAALRPYEGFYRVFILRQVDRATAEAADSLLKTLEEPPSHVILILTASQAELLPATVISRCQRFDLRPASITTVEKTLADRGTPTEQARLLARLSAGRIGWAVDAYRNEALLKQRAEDLDAMVALLASHKVERLDFAWKQSRDQAHLLRLLEQWTSWWRDLLLLSGHGPEYVVNIDRLAELKALARRSDPSQAWLTLRTLQIAIDQIESNVNLRLAIESLLLKLPHWPHASVGSTTKV